MGITDEMGDELAGAGRDELLAFGWSEAAGSSLLVHARLAAEETAEGWILREVASGAPLACLPTASAVRRFAQKSATISDLAGEAPRLASLVLEEELRRSREAVQALERAVADLEDQITELQVKDQLFARDP